MDGVDVAYCEFSQNEQGQWSFEIPVAHCFPYEEKWKARLSYLPMQDAETFAKCNVFYGHFLGKLIKQFIDENQLEGKVDFVSSHGQTVFHNPTKGYTVQIGLGSAIAKECGLPVVCDLRTTDMAYGGQGAPIVPLAEAFLFPEVKQFINIGGITNVQLHKQDKVLGYDICMGNLLLDELCEEFGQDYDKDGELASQGTVNQELLNELNAHPFLEQSFPKSLHRDDVLADCLPVLHQAECSTHDKMATLVEHIAQQITKHIDVAQPTMLTGGGGLNSFLVSRINSYLSTDLIVPERKIIEFKEALSMAFLGLKRTLQEPNVFASVTGAKKDTINGAIYIP